MSNSKKILGNYKNRLERLYNNLYKLTPLRSSFSINMVALVDGSPRVLNLKQILKFILIGSSFVAAVLIVLSSPLITLIFERNAFTSDDTVIVSGIQQLYLIQIPAYIITIVMVRFLESINKNRFMVLAAVICLILNITFNYFLIQYIGIYGLALATSAVAIINSLILYSYINYLNKQQILTT